jgi:hypothetical protein
MVARYLRRTYGYRVTLLIGHSRGSIAGCKWLATKTEEKKSVEMFINVSGRYRMDVSEYRALRGFSS